MRLAIRDQCGVVLKDARPVRLHWLAPGVYNRNSLDAIQADFLLLRAGVFRFLPLSIFFEYVRLAAATPKSYGERLPIRLEATEEGSSATETQIEIFAGCLAIADECRLVIEHHDNWFVIRRGGEKSLVERLGTNWHSADPLRELSRSPG